MKMQSGLLTACLFLSAFTLFACSNVNGEKKVNADEAKEEKKDERVPIEVTTIGRGAIEAVVVSSANLEAEARVKVYARASNRVTALLVEEGDLVEKGQALVLLEDDTQKIELSKAQARLAKAKKEHSRNEGLYEKELITAQAFNDSSYEMEQAQLEVASAQQQLSYTKIHAPISGTVTQRNVNLGDLVKNGGEHLFELIDFNSIVARVYLPEKHLGRLALGQRARVSSKALDDKMVQGSVRRVAPTVDPQTGTVKVTVGVDEIGSLRPGMYVDVTLVLATHAEALLVPKKALVYDNDQVFIYRLSQNKTDSGGTHFIRRGADGSGLRRTGTGH